MARVAPTSPTPAPTPAIQRGDRTTFSPRVDQTITYLTGAPAEIYGLATNAYNNALDAFASATAANTSAGTAGTAATNANTYAGQAMGYRDATLTARDVTLGYRDAAATSATNAENSRLGADKKYLGAKSTFPTVDNQGAALTVGAWYFDITLNRARVWNGTNWIDGVTAVAGVSSVNNEVGALTLKTLNGTNLVGAGDIITRTTAPVETRSSNTQITAADQGKWLKLSGTFTQTFATPAALGNGCAIFISNVGTGEITMPDVDAWGSTWKMYPGETRLFVSDGTALRTIVIEAFRISSQLSGTFEKPPGYRYYDVIIQGGGTGGDGGGGGGSGGTVIGYSGAGGGGGGAGASAGYATKARFRASLFPSSLTYIVGAGGTGGAGGAGGAAKAANTGEGNPGSNGSLGQAGGATTFGSSAVPHAYMTAAGGALNTSLNSQTNFGSRGLASGTAAGGNQVSANAAITTPSPGIDWSGVLQMPSPPPALNATNGASSGTKTSTYAPGGAGGAGGAGAPAANAPRPSGGVGGAALPLSAASNGLPGLDGTSPAKGGPGTGGGGGGGGSGSFGSDQQTNPGLAVGKGGNGGKGADGGDGIVEIMGVR